jgi:hypothetical protein
VGDGGHCSVEEVPQSAQPRGYRDGRGGAQSGGRSPAHPQTSQFHLVFSEMGAGGELHKSCHCCPTGAVELCQFLILRTRALLARSDNRVTLSDVSF